MTPLYIRPGLEPQPLPPIAFDEMGQAWTDLANSPEGRAATGWDREAPPRPADTDAQTADWDAGAEGWVMVDRPPPPPVPEPEPVALTVGQFVSRFSIPDEESQFGEIDDAMMAESRLVRRNWANDRFEFRDGDGFWTILRSHTASIMPAERVTALFARWTGSSIAAFAKDAAA